MEPYPKRLRMRIIELYQQGKPTKEIAEALGTCCSGTRRVRQYQRQRQTLEPLRGKTGPKSGLTRPFAPLHVLSRAGFVLSHQIGVTRHQLNFSAFSARKSRMLDA